LISEAITITADEFFALQKVVKSMAGINLSENKQSFVIARLSSRVKQLHCSSFTDYLKLLSNDSNDEISTFIDKMTTNETYFFREEDHFTYLIQEILPHYFKKYNEELRLWSCACSTGDEPYTLSILLNEFVSKNAKANFKILASDISITVLKKAIDAKYIAESLRKLPDRYRHQCFKQIDEDQWQLLDEYKNSVSFKKINLLKDNYPLKKGVNVIFCRNVMIYFDQETREIILDKLHSALAPNGYLFLGHSESLVSNQCFNQLAHGVFQKKGP